MKTKTDRLGQTGLVSSPRSPQGGGESGGKHFVKQVSFKPGMKDS